MAPSALTGRLVKKLLMSFAATAVTGAAGYAGKKAPQLIEDMVMPKLRETTSQRPTADLAERPRARQLSPAQRDSRRRERAAHRQARRTGSGAKED